MKVKSLDHLHIYSSDPHASAQFYVKHFEAAELNRDKNRNGDTRIFLALGGQEAVLGDFPKDSGPKRLPPVVDGAYDVGLGIAHFGLQVDNVKSAAKELRVAGVDILSEPVTEDSGLSYVYLIAPDGVVVELTQYGEAQ